MKKRKKEVKKRKNEVKKEKKNIISGFISENKEVLRFIALFIILTSFFYFIFFSTVMNKDPSREFTAGIVVFVLNLFGVDAVLDGFKVILEGFTLEVVYECVGVFSIIVYSSFILAYPTQTKKKLIGIAFGLPCLYAIGVIRIASLALIGVSYPTMWDYAHVYFWQLSLIIFVILLLLIWVEKIAR